MESRRFLEKDSPWVHCVCDCVGVWKCLSGLCGFLCLHLEKEELFSGDILMYQEEWKKVPFFEPQV